jgi:excinuclease ABC subunit A
VYQDTIACWKGDSMKKWKERLIASADRPDFPFISHTISLLRAESAHGRGTGIFTGLTVFQHLEEKSKISTEFFEPLPGKDYLPGMRWNQAKRKHLM